MLSNFVKMVIEDGGKIMPMIIPSKDSGGLGIMNPSVFVDDNNIMVILRNVNYTFYHSEKKLFQHPYGPLTYLHPENDLHLRTTNWLLYLDHDLNITKHLKVETHLFDTYEPLWDFVGLEDARLVKWDGKFWITGVRRDTTKEGQGRMELSELKIETSRVTEVARYRIDPPKDPNSYCEKNWMPILDKPFQFVKWSNPTEVVQVYNSGTLNDIDGPGTKSKTIKLGDTYSHSRDMRGGSQVIAFEGHYLAIVHEVDLFKSPEGRKDSIYYHRFILWDKDFNIVKLSDDFHFLDAHVEFCIGMDNWGDNLLITFGFQDNAAFILQCPKKTITRFLNKV